MSASEPNPEQVLRPEAVIAGTLCLMSCFVQHPIALYAARVSANLQLMAGAASLSPELRTICGRLAERWEAIQEDARRRAEGGEAPAELRAFH